jgi:hypothetical protein
MEIIHILNEYRRGDADKRVSLFLYHQGLRDAFDSIERDHPMDLFTVQETPRHTEQGSFRTFIVMLRERLSHLGSRHHPTG